MVQQAVADRARLLDSTMEQDGTANTACLKLRISSRRIAKDGNKIFSPLVRTSRLATVLY